MIVEPDDAVAGPAIDSAISAPEVMVVDSVSALFEVSVSPAVGTEAPKLALPETVVRICTFALTEAASASAELIYRLPVAAGLQAWRDRCRSARPGGARRHIRRRRVVAVDVSKTPP